MQVNRIIIHNLKKEQQEKAELIVSDKSLNPNDKTVISFITELNSRFKANYIQGVFAEKSADEDTFQKEFDTYLKKKKPAIDERFLPFTLKTINLLYNRIDSISAAKGGYIVYADYETLQSRHYFSVFLIRDITGKVFKPKNKTITIEEIIHADTTNLAMACRIDVSKYKSIKQNSDDTYLGFLSIKQQETSAYFLDWIGAERRKKNKENSINLISIITKVDPPNDENGKPIERAVLNRQVYDYIKTYGRKEVNINSLSKFIFDDETVIMNFAEENDIELASDFYPDVNVMKRLIVHSAEGEDIKISYPPGYYMDKIKIDEKDPNTIIIKSKKLADAIRETEKI